MKNDKQAYSLWSSSESDAIAEVLSDESTADCVICVKHIHDWCGQDET